jgi:ATP-dependent DNA helicase RecG
MRNRKGEFLEVTVTDGTGQVTCAFFGRAVHHHARHLTVGRRGLFAGKVSTFRGRRQLAHPDYELVPDLESATPEQAQAFAEEPLPVYPASAKIASWKIARCVELALRLVHEAPDPLPESLRRRHGLLGLAEALEAVHRPATQADVSRGRTRLKWDEALVLQVGLAQRRRLARSLPARAWSPEPDGLLQAFDDSLPFRLTAGQHEVGAKIAADLSSPHPMHRLLQGDVGSGKTVVALRAMLGVVDAGGQAALLAPTEVLAQQHHRSITGLMGPLAAGGRLDQAEHATRVALLTGSQGAMARREALLDVTSGEAGIVVGTHALLQDGVDFAALGLVVVDEQHRFGVEQRDALRAKGVDGRPHLLVMTATPIPRTVAMTVFGDLDVLALTEAPGTRAGVDTHVVPAKERPHHLQRVWERIREEVAQGRRAYVGCPRIGGGQDEAEGEGVGTEPGGPEAEDAAEEERRAPLGVVEIAESLREGPLSGLCLACLHGRMPPEDKEAAMARFASGEVDVLVATTVVEVGVDVPEATVMAVMDADRFGVSQLHQLRGRVGRGSLPGLCLLVTEVGEGGTARERLAAVAATSDGFELSRVDLEQRREGDVLGDAQSGTRSSVRMLALTRDEDLIRRARDEAVALVEQDPQLDHHPELGAELAYLLGDARGEYLEKA